jgi:hypothetical protein
MTRLSPSAQARFSMLAELNAKLARVHNLVEQWATNRQQSDELLMPVGRSFQHLKTIFASEGLDTMAGICASMQVVAKRGIGRQMKMRVLREAVGSLRLQLDVEQRLILAEGAREEEAAKKAEKESEEKQG